ncbi:MAG: helix-turn-helix transcriptional regulator, partial [Bacteroidetes bacterium]|nr:helix-turn-helix transcriptional regulator [Bacteroidota bacterium]
MRGEEVKRILENDEWPLNVLAERLEISPQNLNNWLNVKDIKTGILEKIANAINKNIYYFIDN